MKVQANKTTITEKYEAWDETTGCYEVYDNYTRVQEVIELTCSTSNRIYYVKLNKVCKSYKIVEPELYSHDSILHYRRLATCKNIAECIKTFKEIINDWEKEQK